jgi:hypothetical protein
MVPTLLFLTAAASYTAAVTTSHHLTFVCGVVAGACAWHLIARTLQAL